MSDVLSLSRIEKNVAKLLCCILVIIFVYPTSALGAWGGPNTKQVLGGLGIVIFLINALRGKQGKLPTQLVFATILAFIFSIVNYISTEINTTNDYIYAEYFISFFTWLLGALTVCEVIRWTHGEVSIRLISSYLLVAASYHCVMALLIDNIPELDFFVNKYFISGDNFPKEIGRLYSIGASLDNAGVRFAVTLIVAMYTLFSNPTVYTSSIRYRWYIFGMIVVTVIGNMISRTTLIGLIIGSIVSLYIIIAKRPYRQDTSLIPIATSALTQILIFTVICIVLYNLNPIFRELFRYGFEGFFSFFEEGEWRTDSTDILQTMWVWPTDLQGWIIGYGLFDDWVFGTDIGYCRIVMNSGLIGLTIFSIFFIYQLLAFSIAIPQHKALFISILAVTFTVWFKVSTDIFFFVALLYWIDEFLPKYTVETI